MNSKQEAKMSMYDAVIKHSNENVAIVATIPAFQTALTAFTSKYSSLVATAQLEMNAISGITIDKTVARKNLAQQAADIAAAVFALAASIGNNELKEQARYPISKLTGLKDELLAPACQGIHTLANTNIAALAPYGITAATLTSFQTAIDDYADVIPAPRNAVSQRVTFANSIKTLFTEADFILKEQLDKIAPQFKTANLAFYNAYKNNRIIIDAPTSSTQVTGTVSNSVNAALVPGVVITVQDEAYTTTTDSKGVYNLKIPVPGSYKIFFNKAGYQINSESADVTLGQSTTLNMLLEPLS